jgi:S-(hydroxymethyl)glutathione dehydrogenase/alcohol dehydrogenase
VLGHEGAGEIIGVGEGVDHLVVGDHIIVAWVPPCGHCRSCVKGDANLCLTYTIAAMGNPRFRVGDTPYFGMAGTGTFAEELTLPQQAAVKIDDDVPYEIGALMGCGVMTGVGSVTNVAKVRPGDSVAVVGCGGVGISVIQGARIAGAAEIVAIDMTDRKLDWARQFGATHAVTPDQTEQLKDELTEGDGFDHVFEVVGSAGTIRSAYDLTRRGGNTVIVGVGRPDDQVTFNPFELLFMDRTIKPSYYGGARIPGDFQRLIGLWRAGRLDLEGMITRRLALPDLNDAFESLRAGEVIRQIITFD